MRQPKSKSWPVVELTVFSKIKTKLLKFNVQFRIFNVFQPEKVNGLVSNALRSPFSIYNETSRRRTLKRKTCFHVWLQYLPTALRRPVL